MKKTLTLFAVAIITCLSVFANHRITATMNPYDFQHFVQNKQDSKDVVNSRFGIGCGVGFNWDLNENFILGADIKAETYFIEDQSNFSDISFFAKIGYIARKDTVLRPYLNLKSGLDIQKHDDKTSAVFEFGPELGVKYQISKVFDVFVSCECLFGFPSKDGIKYSEYRLTPSIGIGYTY